MSHSRDDDTGHVFVNGECHCGLKLKDPSVGVEILPGSATNQNFDVRPLDPT